MEGNLERRLETVDKIELRGLFRKKVIVYGKNKYYNDIRILHDYKTGEVLNQFYTNLSGISL